MSLPPMTHWRGPVLVSGDHHALCVPCTERYPVEGSVTDADEWAKHHAATVHPGTPSPTENRQGELL